MAETEDSLSPVEPTPAVLTDTPFPDAEKEPAPLPPPPRRSSPVLPILGGVVAAAIGFGAAQVVPEGWPISDTSALETQLAAQGKEIEALKALRAEPPAAVPDQALTERVTALESAKPADLTGLAGQIAALDQRLAAIESLPKDGAAASPLALAQIQADIAALKSGGGSAALDQASKAIDAKLAEAEASFATLKAEAEATAKAAAARAALQQIAAALDSGAPYSAALASLPDAPAILADHAAAGLPSLQSLRASYPDAARGALEASLRANMGESWTERVSAFLRNQTGARSLTPRDGDDPDAILSRAEAALAAGDLAATLAEVAALPPEGQAAMADWVALARQRQDAASAVQSLIATGN